MGAYQGNEAGERGLEVRDLSLILFWPLALDTEGSKQPKNLFKAVGEVLKSPWEKADPLTHLDGRDDFPSHKAYQEYVYFHPFVKRFLYRQGEGAPVRILQRSDIRGLDLTLFDGKQEIDVSLTVDRIRLHVFETGIVVLAVEVSGKAMPMSQVLRLQNHLRRVYPSYWKGKRAGEYPVRIIWRGEDGEEIHASKALHPACARNWLAGQSGGRARSGPFAAWWLHLLDGLRIENCGGRGETRWRHVADERLPTMLWAAVEGPECIGDGGSVCIKVPKVPQDFTH